MKTKLELIKDLESFIYTNLDKTNIYKNQGRVDWKEDASTVFHIEQDLHMIIAKLQSITLEDIK